MKIVFLDAKTIGNIPAVDAFAKLGEYVQYDTTCPEQVYERVKGADVVITNKVVIDGVLMECCGNLRLICVAATGTNNIDLQAAERLGVTVKNVKGYSTDSVAQHTFALLLALIHRVNWYDQYVKSGEYSKSEIFTCIEHEYFALQGKRYGIIGMGEIGRKVAEVAAVFGAEVVYHSTSGKNLDQPYKHLGLKELLATSDVISIHAALNDDTFDLIGDKELSEFKRTAIVINVGRGGIVNEQALATALDNGVLAGAAIDVFTEEPVKADNPLLHISDKDKLIMSPHIAWAGKEARETLVQRIVDNIQSFF
ncbi:D-2-hydroxyacid dehydrogenase [Cytophagaceae bacterium ABcell3]|nr:D-2-hydroxyacid dehydrogenase [Cytophagaceae bacterium ABcell3]